MAADAFPQTVSKRYYKYVMISIDFFITYLYNDLKKGVSDMAHAVNVNFRMDEDLKKSMESVCSEMGLSMTAAFTIFAKKVSREKRIPFEISADPFYSESNIRHLENIMRNIKEGKAHFTEHELIEAE